MNHNWETCEWCGTSYPSFDKTEIYYQCIVFDKRHLICGSCKEHLELLKDEEYQNKGGTKK